MNPTISTYMRSMQLRSAASRWSGLSVEERKRKMSDLAKKRWDKAREEKRRKEKERKA